MSKKETSTKQLKVLYIGKDLQYFKNIQKKFFEIYPAKEIEFLDLFADDERDVKHLILNIVKETVDIIYLDYSIHTIAMYKLALQLKKETTTKDITLISLLGILDSKDNLRQSLAMGLRVNIIKGIEFSSVVHHAMALRCPEEVKALDFAVAKVEFDAKVQTNFVIGYITRKHLRIESNFIFEENSVVYLKSDIFKDIDFPGYYKVVKSGKRNLYSHFFKWYDFEYIHRNLGLIKKKTLKLESAENELEEDPDNKTKKYDLKLSKEELKRCLEEENKREQDGASKIEDWVEENIITSRPVRTRILIIDKEMKVITKSDEDLGKLCFTLSYYSRIDKDMNAFERTLPQIISFELEYPEIKEIEEEKESEEKPKKKEIKKIIKRDFNSIDALKKIIEKIKTINEYNPFIIVFNAEKEIEAKKAEFSYEKMIFSKMPTQLEVIKNLVDSLENTKNANILPSEFRPSDPRVYLSKYNPKSVVEYGFKIRCINLSESEINFVSTARIPLYTSMYIRVPVKMSITVIPKKDDGKKGATDKKKGKALEYEYYGIIHGLGETETTGLRKYVNDLFFDTVNRERQQEKLDFENVNKEYKENEREALEEMNDEKNKKKKKNKKNTKSNNDE